MLLKIAEKEISQLNCCGEEVSSVTIVDKNISCGEEFPGWITVWNGIKTFTASGSFSVPDISTNDEVRICAVAEFSVYSYDPAYGNETVSTEKATLTEAVLPVSASSSNASINISHSGGLISFEFIPYEMNYKGYVNEETPTKITFTVVRKKV